MSKVPNILSAFRILLVPIFVVLYFSGLDNSGRWAAAVFIVASATDVLDGLIARKYNVITNLGKILDPLGDKLMTLSVLTCITVDHRIPVWVLVLFYIKELVMLLGGAFIHKKLKTEMIPSNILGKASTVLFFIVCVLLLLFESISFKAANIMVTVAVAFAFLALGSYVFTFKDVKRRAEGHSN